MANECSASKSISGCSSEEKGTSTSSFSSDNNLKESTRHVINLKESKTHLFYVLQSDNESSVTSPHLLRIKISKRKLATEKMLLRYRNDNNEEDPADSPQKIREMSKPKLTAIHKRTDHHSFVVLPEVLSTKRSYGNIQKGIETNQSTSDNSNETYVIRSRGENKQLEGSRKAPVINQAFMGLSFGLKSNPKLANAVYLRGGVTPSVDPKSEEDYCECDIGAKVKTKDKINSGCHSTNLDQTKIERTLSKTNTHEENGNSDNLFNIRFIEPTQADMSQRLRAGQDRESRYKSCNMCPNMKRIFPTTSSRQRSALQSNYSDSASCKQDRNGYVKINYKLVRQCLIYGSAEEKCPVLDAIRLRIKSPDLNVAMSTIQDIVKFDLFGVQCECRSKPLLEELFWPIHVASPYSLQASIARFLNALVSYKIGRDYFNNRSIIPLLTWGDIGRDNIDTVTGDNLIGIMMKLSCSRFQCSDMIKNGLVDWLLSHMEEVEYSASKYHLECMTMLLRNLLKGENIDISSPIKIKKLIVLLGRYLDTENDAVKSYICDSLLTSCQKTEIVACANELNFREIIEKHITKTVNLKQKEQLIEVYQLLNSSGTSKSFRNGVFGSRSEQEPRLVNDIESVAEDIDYYPGESLLREKFSGNEKGQCDKRGFNKFKPTDSVNGVLKDEKLISRVFVEPLHSFLPNIEKNRIFPLSNSPFVDKTCLHIGDNQPKKRQPYIPPNSRTSGLPRPLQKQDSKERPYSQQTVSDEDNKSVILQSKQSDQLGNSVSRPFITNISTISHDISAAKWNHYENKVGKTLKTLPESVSLGTNRIKQTFVKRSKTTNDVDIDSTEQIEILSVAGSDTEERMKKVFHNDSTREEVIQNITYYNEPSSNKDEQYGYASPTKAAEKDITHDKPVISADRKIIAKTSIISPCETNNTTGTIQILSKKLFNKETDEDLAKPSSESELHLLVDRNDAVSANQTSSKQTKSGLLSSKRVIKSEGGLNDAIRKHELQQKTVETLIIKSKSQVFGVQTDRQPFKNSTTVLDNVVSKTGILLEAAAHSTTKSNVNDCPSSISIRRSKDLVSGAKSVDISDEATHRKTGKREGLEDLGKGNSLSHISIKRSIDKVNCVKSAETCDTNKDKVANVRQSLQDLTAVQVQLLTGEVAAAAGLQSGNDNAVFVERRIPEITAKSEGHTEPPTETHEEPMHQKPTTGSRKTTEEMTATNKKQILNNSTSKDEPTETPQIDPKLSDRLTTKLEKDVYSVKSDHLTDAKSLIKPLGVADPVLSSRIIKSKGQYKDEREMGHGLFPRSVEIMHNTIIGREISTDSIMESQTVQERLVSEVTMAGHLHARSVEILDGPKKFLESSTKALTKSDSDIVVVMPKDYKLSGSSIHISDNSVVNKGKFEESPHKKFGEMTDRLENEEAKSELHTRSREIVNNPIASQELLTDSSIEPKKTQNVKSNLLLLNARSDEVIRSNRDQNFSAASTSKENLTSLNKLHKLHARSEELLGHSKKVRELSARPIAQGMKGDRNSSNDTVHKLNEYISEAGKFKDYSAIQTLKPNEKVIHTVKSDRKIPVRSLSKQNISAMTTNFSDSSTTKNGTFVDQSEENSTKMRDLPDLSVQEGLILNDDKLSKNANSMKNEGQQSFQPYDGLQEEISTLKMKRKSDDVPDVIATTANDQQLNSKDEELKHEMMSLPIRNKQELNTSAVKLGLIQLTTDNEKFVDKSILKAEEAVHFVKNKDQIFIHRAEDVKRSSFPRISSAEDSPKAKGNAVRGIKSDYGLSGNISKEKISSDRRTVDNLNRVKSNQHVDGIDVDSKDQRQVLQDLSAREVLSTQPISIKSDHVMSSASKGELSEMTERGEPEGSSVQEAQMLNDVPGRKDESATDAKLIKNEVITSLETGQQTLELYDRLQGEVVDRGVGTTGNIQQVNSIEKSCEEEILYSPKNDKYQSVTDNPINEFAKDHEKLDKNDDQTLNARSVEILGEHGKNYISLEKNVHASNDVTEVLAPGLFSGYSSVSSINKSKDCVDCQGSGYVLRARAKPCENCKPSLTKYPKFVQALNNDISTSDVFDPSKTAEKLIKSNTLLIKENITTADDINNKTNASTAKDLVVPVISTGKQNIVRVKSAQTTPSMKIPLRQTISERSSAALTTKLIASVEDPERDIEISQNNTNRKVNDNILSIGSMKKKKKTGESEIKILSNKYHSSVSPIASKNKSKSDDRLSGGPMKQSVAVTKSDQNLSSLMVAGKSKVETEARSESIATKSKGIFDGVARDNLAFSRPTENDNDDTIEKLSSYMKNRGPTGEASGNTKHSSKESIKDRTVTNLSGNEEKNSRLRTSNSSSGGFIEKKNLLLQTSEIMNKTASNVSDNITQITGPDVTTTLLRLSEVQIVDGDTGTHFTPKNEETLKSESSKKEKTDQILSTSSINTYSVDCVESNLNVNHKSMDMKEIIASAEQNQPLGEVKSDKLILIKLSKTLMTEQVNQQGEVLTNEKKCSHALDKEINKKTSYAKSEELLNTGKKTERTVSSAQSDHLLFARSQEISDGNARPRSYRQVTNRRKGQKIIKESSSNKPMDPSQFTAESIVGSSSRSGSLQNLSLSLDVRPEERDDHGKGNKQNTSPKVAEDLTDEIISSSKNDHNLLSNQSKRTGKQKSDSRSLPDQNESEDQISDKTLDTTITSPTGDKQLPTVLGKLKDNTADSVKDDQFPLGVSAQEAEGLLMDGDNSDHLIFARSIEIEMDKTTVAEPDSCDGVKTESRALPSSTATLTAQAITKKSNEIELKMTDGALNSEQAGLLISKEPLKDEAIVNTKVDLVRQLTLIGPSPDRLENDRNLSFSKETLKEQSAHVLQRPQDLPSKLSKASKRPKSHSFSSTSVKRSNKTSVECTQNNQSLQSKYLGVLSLNLTLSKAGSSKRLSIGNQVSQSPKIVANAMDEIIISSEGNECVRVNSVRKSPIVVSEQDADTDMQIPELMRIDQNVSLNLITKYNELAVSIENDKNSSENDEDFEIIKTNQEVADITQIDKANLLNTSVQPAERIILENSVSSLRTSKKQDGSSVVPLVLNSEESASKLKQILNDESLTTDHQLFQHSFDEDSKLVSDQQAVTSIDVKSDANGSDEISPDEADQQSQSNKNLHSFLHAEDSTIIRSKSDTGQQLSKYSEKKLESSGVNCDWIDETGSGKPIIVSSERKSRLGVGILPRSRNINEPPQFEPISPRSSTPNSSLNKSEKDDLIGEQIIPNVTETSMDTAVWQVRNQKLSESQQLGRGTLTSSVPRTQQSLSGTTYGHLLHARSEEMIRDGTNAAHKRREYALSTSVRKLNDGDKNRSAGGATARNFTDQATGSANLLFPRSVGNVPVRRPTSSQRSKREKDILNQSVEIMKDNSIFDQESEKYLPDRSMNNEKGESKISVASNEFLIEERIFSADERACGTTVNQQFSDDIAGCSNVKRGSTEKGKLKVNNSSCWRKLLTNDELINKLSEKVMEKLLTELPNCGSNCKSPCGGLNRYYNSKKDNTQNSE